MVLPSFVAQVGYSLSCCRNPVQGSLVCSLGFWEGGTRAVRARIHDVLENLQLQKGSWGLGFRV